MKTGACSITFRSLSMRDVAELVRDGGLDAIEWGGDIHVPHGDLRAAALARRITEEAGLAVSSYGSYYRVLDAGGRAEDFAPVRDAALALGTDVIRIWAGRCGSNTCDASRREKLVEASRRAAVLAQEHDLKLAFEFHANTLTDTNESALQLHREIDQPNVYSYWQPPYWCTDMEYRYEGLDALKDRVLNIHTFQWNFDCDEKKTWNEAIDRRPLAEGTAEWLRYLDVPLMPGTEHYALLEFVAGGTPAQFLRDAAVLKGWLARLSTAQKPGYLNTGVYNRLKKCFC